MLTKCRTTRRRKRIRRTKRCHLALTINQLDICTMDPPPFGLGNLGFLGQDRSHPQCTSHDILDRNKKVRGFPLPKFFFSPFALLQEKSQSRHHQTPRGETKPQQRGQDECGTSGAKSANVVAADQPGSCHFFFWGRTLKSAIRKDIKHHPSLI